ncbi:DNA repair protein complementing XP-C cells homolog [Anopheles maculipalpis]|uniref:DNA repair protein complementing XP-C cells homolog n=1 Tax=Anopheles maculipalpis TaxID=1496333 RepID=UPI002159054A|nr:DNA repair protein complementing XP-C cells homolog [Anopheles maculipalpis]
MSDTFMSDSEEDGGDFSVSEDEWLPEKADRKNKSRRRDSSDGDSDNSDDSDVISINKGKEKTLVSIKNGLANSIPNNKRPFKRPGQATGMAGGRRSVKRSHQDSDSSGDEHLVDPTKLDLNSKFFDAISSNPLERTSSSSQQAPTFDCNAGIGKLSDSSEDENEATQNNDKDARGVRKLIKKINETSQTYVQFQDFSKTLETAKNQLQNAAKKQQQELIGISGNTSDVSHLLALGEKGTVAASSKNSSAKAAKGKKGAKKQADSDSDWEEVEEGTSQPSTSRTESVQITLKPELAAQKKKSKCTEFDVEACIKRMINREKRDAQLVLHKMTIIMGVAHGNFTNSVLNSPALLAIGNALIPSERCYPKGQTNVEYLRQIMQYYREIVDLKDRRMFVNSWKKLSLEKSLRLQLLSQMANCKRDYILLFIILLRSIGVQCRMVTSLQVVPKVLSSSDLLKVVPAKEKLKVTAAAKKNVTDDHNYGKEQKKKSNSHKKRKASLVEIPQLDGAEDIAKPSNKRSKKGRESAAQEASKEIVTSDIISPRKTRKQRLDQEKSKEKGDKKSIENNVNKPVETKKSTQKSNSDKGNSSKSKNSESSQMIRRDYTQKKEEVIIKPPAKRSPTKITASSTPTASNHKKIVKIERFNPKTRKLLNNPVLSTDDESGSNSSSKKVNLWIEAYAEEEKRWVPLDVTRGLLDCVTELVQQASSPMLYILAWNNDGSIKDVSARYCADYLTVAIKHRIMQQWMDNLLFPYSGDRQTVRDIAEDRELNRILEERPLPRTVSEYKNHPYFALKRHLLKFEAIYPPDAPTLGFTSGKEPVYARECVHTLHAREVWLKQARTVKMFETPYKVVSGRPKYDRASGQMLPSQPLELFGHWQTEEYEPPTAEDGIVPRNAYGNVELFKPCMLPKKTVHLQLPGLNRICRKLRIDCAQAVTGFDFHGGSSHPVYDGFVVCEEFRDVVVDAWHQEQEAEEQRAREKYEKRVYGNWKKLIKGLLIRRKLQHKYNFDNLNQ